MIHYAIASRVWDGEKTIPASILCILASDDEDHKDSSVARYYPTSGILSLDPLDTDEPYASVIVRWTVFHDFLGEKNYPEPGDHSLGISIVNRYLRDIGAAIVMKSACSLSYELDTLWYFDHVDTSIDKMVWKQVPDTKIISKDECVLS